MMIHYNYTINTTEKQIFFYRVLQSGDFHRITGEFRVKNPKKYNVFKKILKKVWKK